MSNCWVSSAIKVRYLVLATSLSFLVLNGCGGSSPKVAAPTSLTYLVASLSANVGLPIASDTPTVTGTVTSYSISPALPAGFNFNTTTGVISGTPTTTSSGTAYNVTANNSGGSTTATIYVTVGVPIIAPSALAYSPSSVSVLQGTTISNMVPTYSGSAATFTISPTLPQGISLNNSSGVISGTSLVAGSPTSYTVTATNLAGSTTSTVQIAINPELAPTAFSYSPSSIVCHVGQTAGASATYSGSPATQFTVSPAFTGGLGFYSNAFGPPSGAIFGQCATPGGPTTYTITVTNYAGSTSTTVQVTILP